MLQILIRLGFVNFHKNDQHAFMLGFVQISSYSTSSIILRVIMSMQLTCQSDTHSQTNLDHHFDQVYQLLKNFQFFHSILQ